MRAACTHTAFKSNTNLADITNHDTAAKGRRGAAHCSVYPSAGRLDRDETEDTKSGVERAREEGANHCGRGRGEEGGRRLGWLVGSVEQRVGSLPPLGSVCVGLDRGLAGETFWSLTLLL